jgi:hypothetical protein
VQSSLPRLNLEHLQHFIAVVIDNLDGDFAGGGPGEGTADGGVKGRPGGFVDLRLEGLLELFIWLVSAGEIGVPDKEAFAVIVGVKEPAGQVVGGTAANLAGGGVVNVQALEWMPSFQVSRKARICSGCRVRSSILPSFTSRFQVLTCQLEANLMPYGGSR